MTSAGVGSILIIDDEESSRASLEALLELDGYQLFFAAEARVGMELAVEHLPDLILLDVMMPDMDGFEACERLRGDPRLEQIPILMVTALDDQDSRLRGLQCGADDFISKPINRSELRARVSTIMRLGRYRRLTEERAKFEWITRQARDGYVIITPGDEIVYANPKALNYLQVEDAAACTGHKFLELADKHYLREPAAAWDAWPKAASAPQDTPRYLIYPESAHSTPLWLHVEVFVIKEKERLLCLRDVTEQMGTLRNMQTFHSMIQHKLRTPLEPIISGLSFLAQNSATLEPELHEEFLDMALNSAHQLNNEIGRILVYLNSNKLIEPAMSVALNGFTENIEEIARHIGIEQAQVRIDAGLRDALSQLGKQSLEWIVTELLLNSKKFHPRQDPKVSIEFLDLAQSGYFCLRVVDDGVTLPPEQVSNAWQPYYQGEKYFTGQAPGVGLGLPTIAMLVWQIGGRCKLYNRSPGPGVVVELHLPYETYA